MSLYRQTGASRWRAVAAAVGVALVAGGVIGYAIGRSSAPEPTMAEKVGELQDDVQPVLDGLSLVPDHYKQGIAAGGGVQLDGAVQQAAFARETYVALEADIRALSDHRYEAAVVELDALVEAMRGRAAVPQVRQRAQAAQGAVEESVGISSGLD
jgi:hypothetical protein